jgi:hypothetical protein
MTRGKRGRLTITLRKAYQRHTTAPKMGCSPTLGIVSSSNQSEKSLLPRILRLNGPEMSPLSFTSSIFEVGPDRHNSPNSDSMNIGLERSLEIVLYMWVITTVGALLWASISLPSFFPCSKPPYLIRHNVPTRETRKECSDYWPS